MSMNWSPRFAGSDTLEAHVPGGRYSLTRDGLGRPEMQFNGITVGRFGVDAVGHGTFQSATRTTTMATLPDRRTMFSNGAAPLGYATARPAGGSLFHSASGANWSLQSTPTGFGVRPGF
jgi:hypothetical protein